MKIAPFNESLKYAMILAVFLVAGRLLGQVEPEAAEKYRVVYDYKVTEIETSKGDGVATSFRPRLISDSVGVFYEYDNRVSRLLQMHRSSNQRTIDGPGFRIQIYAGSKMENANEAKTSFLQAFRNTEMEVYKDWNPPHFWVRVGDFISRNDAMKHLPGVRQVFPDAFVVQDKIKMPKYQKPALND
jgi:SPOR domain